MPERSRRLLSDLIPHTYHTYLFDNSSEDSEITLVAEIENGSAFIVYQNQKFKEIIYFFVYEPAI
jgi:hypothetical protein